MRVKIDFILLYADRVFFVKKFLFPAHRLFGIVADILPIFIALLALLRCTCTSLLDSLIHVVTNVLKFLNVSWPRHKFCRSYLGLLNSASHNSINRDADFVEDPLQLFSIIRDLTRNSKLFNVEELVDHKLLSGSSSVRTDIVPDPLFLI